MALETNALTTLATVRTELGVETFAAWAGSTAYVIGDRVKNGGNNYEVTVAGTSAASGGPTGTGTTIVDGTVTWKFVSVNDDAYLENAIDVASDLIEQFCGRSFFKETGREDFLAGYGNRRLTVQKTPILTLTKIEFVDQQGSLTLIDSDGYEIEDADIGFIRRIAGWNWTVAVGQEITPTPLPGDERRAFKVTYDCGFVTPEQVGTRTLPFDLEDACVQLIVARFRARGRDPAVKSEKLMNWSTAYGAMPKGVPDTVSAILDRYTYMAAA